MKSNMTFYSQITEMVNCYNSLLEHEDISSTFININKYYDIIYFKNKNIDDFNISNNFLNFINTLELSGPHLGDYYKIIDIIKSIFTGNINKYTYNILYKQFFNKLKFIKEYKDGYIIVNGDQKIKIGKLIKTILRIMSVKTDINLPKYIENITDKYKSWYESKKEIKFNVLKGKEILKGYTVNEHEYLYRSSLNTSCMNNRFHLLKLYTQNENKLLLLSLERNDKILGRCLLWKLDKPNIIYMDRVYVTNNFIRNIFENFAIYNKISYRVFQNNKNFIINYYNNKQCKYEQTDNYTVNFKVKLNINNILSYPYMDSFKIMNIRNGVFYTHSNKKLYLKYTELESTNGNHEKYTKLFGIKLH